LKNKKEIRKKKYFFELDPLKGMSSDSGGSEVSKSDEIEQVERLIIKAITYSDECLLKGALKKYKREKIHIDDAKVLHHAVRLAKTKVIL